MICSGTNTQMHARCKLPPIWQTYMWLTEHSFVCATSQETSDIVHLTSFKARRGRDDLIGSATIWEAARATTAAASVFEPIAIGPHRTVFLDGGTGANNPIYELWVLAMDEFSPSAPKDGSSDLDLSLEKNVKCIVSIGTGVPNPSTFGSYPIGLGKALLSISTETEQTARRFARDKSALSDAGRYFRFNVPSGLYTIAMDDPKNLDAIVAVTTRYLEDQDTFKKIEACAKLLMNAKCKCFLKPWLFWNFPAILCICHVNYNMGPGFWSSC